MKTIIFILGILLLSGCMMGDAECCHEPEVIYTNKVEDGNGTWQEVMGPDSCIYMLFVPDDFNEFRGGVMALAGKQINPDCGCNHKEQR
jgi:hypothetical protein